MQKAEPHIVDVEPRGCSAVNSVVIMSAYNFFLNFSANNNQLVRLEVSNLSHIRILDPHVGIDYILVREHA